MGIVAKAQLDVEWDGSGLDATDMLNVLVDGVRVNDAPLPAWPDGENLDGYGWGRGRWGMGSWGLGGDLSSYSTPLVADGAHTVGVVSIDQAGNETEPVEAEILVQGVPRPPEDLAALSYVGGVLTLGFTPSKDDEG